MVNLEIKQPCIGYQRFEMAWLRNGLLLSRIPSEKEWEDMLENSYPYEPERFSNQELLEIFPEALPIIKRNISIYKKEYNELEPLLEELLREIYKEIFKSFADKNFKQQYHWMTLEEEKQNALRVARKFFYEKPLNEIQLRIKRLERFVASDEWKRKPPNTNEITDQDILRAKEYPLENFLPEINRAGFARCPFHNERTGSFKFYKDQNRWHCYGCNEGGDVIDFIMKSEDLDFISAVKKLLLK